MSKILLTIFLAAVLLTAGCNGTNTQQSNNGGNTQTSAAVSVTQQTSQTDRTVSQTTRQGETERTTPTTQMRSTTTTAAVSSGGALDAIKGLLGMGLTQWMVDYQMSIKAEGQESSGSMAYYYKGGQVRTDTVLSGIESRTFIKTGSAISCMNQGGTWMCYNLPAQDNSQDVGKSLEDAKKNIDSSPITPLPDRMIAGVNTKCFKTTTKTTDQKGAVTTWDQTYCLSPEGVPLYSEASSASMHSVMTATKYSTQVSDADFVPPAKIQDLSAMNNYI